MVKQRKNPPHKGPGPKPVYGEPEGHRIPGRFRCPWRDCAGDEKKESTYTEERLVTHLRAHGIIWKRGIPCMESQCRRVFSTRSAQRTHAKKSGHPPVPMKKFKKGVTGEDVDSEDLASSSEERKSEEPLPGTREHNEWQLKQLQ